MRRLARTRRNVQADKYRGKRVVTTHPPLLREQAEIHKHIGIKGKRAMNTHPPYD